MATNPKQASSLGGLFSDLNIRINDLEERQNVITEKLSVLSQTLLSTTQRVSKEMAMIGEDMSSMKQDIDKVKSTTQILLEQASEFASKQDLQTFDKYMRLWEPMNFATIDDVKKMIQDAIKNKHASSKDKIINVEE